MPYVPVPKDLTKVKTKVAAGLTKRQPPPRLPVWNKKYALLNVATKRQEVEI